jgi:FkbM family methyltransferase
MLTRPGQFLRDRYLRRPARTGSPTLAARVYSRLERLVLRFEDPLVHFRFAGFDLRLPLSHRLPVFLHTCPHYNRNLGRLGKLVHQRYPGMTAIDVGANVGDSVAVLRSQSNFPILCVEADATFFDLLQQNAKQFADVELARAYLGESPSRLPGRLVSSSGTGHVQAAPNGAAETIHIRTLCDLLAEHPRFAAPKFVKIDTDGYDCKILRGAAPCLSKSKPVLFFEYDTYFLRQSNDDGLSAFATLKDLGYTDLLVYDNLGVLLGPARIDDDAALLRIHNEYCDGRPGGRYTDLCAFHAEDQGLFAAALTSESEYFKGTPRPSPSPLYPGERAG